MEPVTVYRTFDGKKHDSIQLANRHLDNLRAPILHDITVEIQMRDAAAGKKYILDNLDKFRKLWQIENDYTLRHGDIDVFCSDE